MRVLVTGASGFVGRALVDEILARGQQEVLGTVRRAPKNAKCRLFETGDLAASPDWSNALEGTDVVIHLAGRAHVLSDAGADRLNEFRKINVDATVSLAKAAVKAGVRRFVFVSSIGVNGAKTSGAAFSEDCEPLPVADYAFSKLEAEQQLRTVLNETDVELVIVRPPLVYAGHAPGNFRRLLKLVSTGLPLPFGKVRNARTMVALDNLVDLLICCIDHPRAANEVFLCADNESISLPEMVRLLADGMGRKTRLIPFPVFFLKLAAALLRKRSVIDQLCSSLVVNNLKTKQFLGWAPVVDAKSALRAAGRDYMIMEKERLQ